MLAAVSILGALIAIFEVMVFSFLGDLVNWLTASERDTFFADNVGSLLWMGAVILIAMPVLTLLWELTFHQGLMGNYPMAIRWQVHRYLLAYASDFHLLGTAMQPHAISSWSPDMQVASLDHSLWYHRPLRMDDWLLYAMDSPSASGSRGLSRGQIFNRAGELVASVTQESLMRRVQR